MRFHQVILTLSLFCFSFQIKAQVSSTDYLSEIKKLNLSTVLTSDSILADGDQFIKKMAPLGFFGDNYQRLHIKFISVIKDERNPLQYFVYGKTKLQGNISEFQGTFIINESQLYNESDIPGFKQGIVKGAYNFFEDRNKAKTGEFFGSCELNFAIDNKGYLIYDALTLVADGFDNNQFEGKWKSYSSGTEYTCNWGDYRIPNSGNLDTGAGGFNTNDEYLDRGWRTFELAKGYGMNATDQVVERARKTEHEKWWK